MLNSWGEWSAVCHTEVCSEKAESSNLHDFSGSNQCHNMFSSFDTTEKDSNGTKRLQYAQNFLEQCCQRLKSLRTSHCSKRDTSTAYSVLIILLYSCTSFTHIQCFTITSPSNFDLTELSIFTSKRMSPVSLLVGHGLACTIGWSGIGKCHKSVEKYKIPGKKLVSEKQTRC